MSICTIVPFRRSVIPGILFLMFLFDVQAFSQHINSVQSGIPVVSSFTPMSGPVGTIVTITGSNFSATKEDNIVWFGGVKVAVTNASDASLTITVPPGSISSSISVTVGGITGVSSRMFDVTFGTGGDISAGSFDNSATFSTGVQGRGIAAGDLDGDGKVDIVVADDGAKTISVLHNSSTKGTVSFDDKVDFAAGDRPSSVALADFDGDGLLDIVCANLENGNIGVYRNTSTPGTITSGSFASRKIFTTGNNPWDIAVGDLDGDGLIDIAVVCQLSSAVTVLRNKSTAGVISFDVMKEFAAESIPQGVAIGDIDGDGKLDIAIGNNGSGSVSVFHNTSTAGSITTASFDSAVNFSTDSPRGIALRDLNGDGKPELIAGGTNYMTVFPNTATSGSITTGSFGTKKLNAAGSLVQCAVVGDYNGDGLPDLASANYNGNSVSVVQNLSTTGALNFSGPLTIAANKQPRYAATGDFNNDGKPDIAVVNYANPGTITILQNTFSSSTAVQSRQEILREFSLSQNYPNPFNPTTTLAFTLLKDGITTLKIYNVLGQEVATLVNEALKAGEYHKAVFNATNFASGIYIARLQSGNQVQLKKMLLLK